MNENNVPKKTNWTSPPKQGLIETRCWSSTPEERERSARVYEYLKNKPSAIAFCLIKTVEEITGVKALPGESYTALRERISKIGCQDLTDENYKEETGEKCPQCGSTLVFRKGKYGEFTACSNYPECKYIEKEEKAARLVKRNEQ